MKSTRSGPARRLPTLMGATMIAAMLFSPFQPLVALAGTPPAHETAAFQEEPPVPTDAPVTTTGGLTIALSEGAAQAQAPITSTVALGEALSEEETAALLGRLPALEGQAADVQQFRLPPEPLPPPAPQTIITTTFPATQTAAAPEPESDALMVERYAPEGDIRIAPFLQVTFNQPMVPLGTLEELSAADVPVTLTPELPGVWKWLGTQTLTFEYRGGEVDRFPMATEYTAEIPAGTTSATGGVLGEAVTWTFRTPAPIVITSHPAFGPQRRDALIFVAFDQLIDPAAVLDTIRVTVGGVEVPVRLAAAEEVAADPAVADMAKGAGEGRWLAFRAEQEFPADATVNVNVGPGTPSAEGPLTTEEVQSLSFQTFAPLRVTRAECAWGGTRCQPGTPFAIVFNNPLDAEAFDPAWVTVDPEIPGMIVEVFGSTLQVRGATAGRSTYEVTVGGEVRDIFGQTLGQARTLDFHTDVAYPSLSGPYLPLVTLDPADPTPTFDVYSVNYPELHVRIYRVTPPDWPQWQQYLQNYWQETPPTPPGELVVDQFVQVQGETDQLAETAIGLQTALGGASTGHLIVIVDIPPQAGRERDRTSLQSWVQVTQIGLDAVSDHETLLAWATQLTDGAPLEGVAVELVDSGKQGATGADGTLRLDLPDAPSNLLVATLGDDTAILPRSPYDYYGESGWRKNTPQDELRWYVFDDRQMYRPNEEVHLKGWLRRIGMTQAGDVALGDDLPTTVQYQVSDPLGNPITDGVVELNDLGGFDFSFTLAENVNLGYANIYLRANGAGGSLNGQEYYHTFQIQEFRRPEFEVKAQPEGEGPYFLLEDAVVSVSAQYYAGGPLPAAETTWNVSASPASYSPPNWDEFVFGEWVPWWYGPYYASDVVFGGGSYFDGTREAGTGEQTNTFTSATDPSGLHYLRMGFLRSEQPRPYTVSAQATVMDVNRQAWSSSASLLVHPAELYVGLRSASTFVEQGDPLEIDVIVTDVDGNAAAERSVTVRAAKLDYKYEQGEWTEVETDPQTCEIVSGNEPESCTFTTELGGEYRITAEVRDDRERLNRTVLTRWVSGGTARPARNVEQETAELIPDKETYAPGDVAEILVVSPFTPAEGLLTVARSGIITTERFTVENGTATLRIPIEEAHMPNLSVQVDLTGAAARLDDKGEPVADAPPRPAYALGALSLPVPPRSRTLTLEVAPEATSLAPGEATAIALRATDTAGNPVENAELAVVVVDEAILALTGYTVPDPLAAFYTERWSGVDSVYTRASIVLANPADMAQAMAGGRGGGGGDAAMAVPAAAAPMEEAAAEAMPLATMAPGMAADMAFEREKAETAATPIAVRSDFNPLAVFVPAVHTDADGRARVEFTLPDNLTRYRVTVVAATEKQFGKAESNVTARLPLMVRPSAPRFLNFGDRFQLPIVVQNQTDAPLSVQVAVTATNLLLTAGSGQRVEIPANDRVEVRFPAETENAGTARFQVAVSASGEAGDFADAASGELPVYTPATTEAFATYGIVDDGAVAQPLTTPENVFPQFGGLEVSTSSTALSALTDALIYLVNYPFECSEQIASRIIGITALRDVLTAFDAAGLPPAEQLNAFVQVDIERLVGMQNLDGGFPIWERGRESVPYYSIHGAHALARARLKDYPVADDAIGRALDYLRNIEGSYPSYYSEITKRTLSAYALYVRDLLGDTDTAEARALLAQLPVEEWSLEALAWLWQVLGDDPSAAAEVEAIRSYLNNQAVETPSTANFFISYGDDAYLLLHSNRRTDAIILDAYINEDPENSLIPKLVNGLLAGSSNGRWANTQENVFVLLALDNYFNTYESVTPDFVARIWLGDVYVAESTFQGYSDEIFSTLVPMDFLLQQEGTQDVIVAKEGDGRLYYRLGLKYAPTDLQLDPLDMGFVVQRTYHAVDDPADVQRDADGVWRIKAGAKVRVELTMVARNRRYHVALTDPLPAGLEAINPALAISQDVPTSPQARPYGWWWYNTWYEHQNLRDQRAEAFTTLLWDGVYTYEYVARATTPGEFVVPPARAEEMYSPEVFGRSASDRVIVE